MIQKIAIFTPEYGQRIKSVIDTFTPSSPPTAMKNPNAVLSGYSSPVEITGDWEQEQALWKCKAKRLWHTDGKYETRDDGLEIDLYDPCSNDKPEVGTGDRVYAVFRGVWEMVGGVGGGGVSKIYAVVMTA
ncbi:MAG: hypothetical protein LBC20_18125, partial [Planctomycetaceae bacterium]|nr:hypothetical protein [Planctomycetaceae bacterium]